MQQIDSMDGLFHDGNPATGELGTIVTASWLNSVQGELANLVTGLGGTLDAGKHDQLKTLLSAALDSKAVKATTLAGYGIGDAAPKHNAALTGTPTAPTAPAGTATTQLATTGFVTDALASNTGLPLLFPLWCPNRAAIPAGYAPADGQTLARSLYPDAWAGIAAGNVPTVADASWLSTPTERGKFTAGDGSTTFRLPDYNGKAAGSLGAVFMRGDGVLSAGTAGTIQRDGVGSVDVPTSTNLSNGGAIVPNYFSSKTRLSGGVIGSGEQGWYGTYSDSITSQTTARTNSVNMGSTDTRPLNATGCWVIRLFGTVTNPGAADAAQLATEVAKLRAEAMPGSFKNLRASSSGTNSVIAVSVDAIAVDDGVGNCRTVRNVALSINAAAAGVNGLDTGALAASTWYAVHVIYNPTTQAAAGVLSLSATVPTLPAGYTMSARCGWIRTDGTANKFPLGFRQYGRKIQYLVTAGSNVTGLPQMAYGAAGSTSTPTWVPIGTSAYIPQTASEIVLLLTSANAPIMAAPNSSYGAHNSTTNPPPLQNDFTVGPVQGRLLVESSNIYWANPSSSAGIHCMGWEDNL